MEGSVGKDFGSTCRLFAGLAFRTHAYGRGKNTKVAVEVQGAVKNIILYKCAILVPFLIQRSQILNL